MEIPFPYRDLYAYHFTHLDNLDSIVRNGLLATNNKNARSISHRNVASSSIQRRRHNMEVPCGPGGTIHDYVPFYFCTVNPMFLSVLNTRNVDQQFMVFLCIPIAVLLEEGSVFTNASANTNIPPDFYEDPAQLGELDWAAINSRKWKDGSDKERQRRMAELLIYDHVDIAEIQHIVVWNNDFGEEVKKIFDDNGKPAPSLGIEPFNWKYFYFTKFQSDKPTQSLVTGPFFFKEKFEETVQQILENRGTEPAPTFPFHDIGEALAAIKEDFGSIAEMAEIWGLKVWQLDHQYVVSEHTQDLVDNLKRDAFYKRCEKADRDVLLLSAYLHGIGKAPVAGSSGNTHQVFTDYPLDSMEKLVRLLSEEIEVLSDEEVRKICLLVGYHDLVTDIILRHRDKKQLFDLIQDTTELDMLIAISVAGIPAGQGVERTSVKMGAKKLRQEALNHLAE
jgi:hypothetical protein